MRDQKSAREVLEEFYEAERTFMKAGGSRAGASFADMAATLDENVVLHQSPDLPFGGEYVGHDRYREWADAMSAIFDRVDARGPEFFEKNGKVIIECTLVTRVRGSGGEIELPMVQVVSVKAGKITEFRPFYWNVPAYVAAAEGRTAGTRSTLETLKEFYDAEASYMKSDVGDFSAVASTLDPDCVIYEPESLPYGGEWRGHDGFEAWMKQFAGEWSSLEVKDSVFYALDKVIFSQSHVYATARKTGLDADWPLLQLIRFREGKILEIRPFHWDTADILPALGHSPGR